MTDNASLIEEIVKSLSFEVVAIPNQTQKVVPSTTTKATPLNIKVKVKKKHDGGLQHGVLTTPVKDPDEVPQRIRLVSSDQTIMSFNAVMEDIDFDKSRIPKPILQNINNQPHTSSTTEVAGTLKNKYLLTEAEDDLNKKKDIFGRCKPGGCLDPPFGEDKYAYEPLKLEEKVDTQDAPVKKRTSSIFSNKLFNKFKKPKTNKVDVKNGESGSNPSISSSNQTRSLQTSNSIITYPSLLNESNDKLIQDRQKSPRHSATKKSRELDNGSLYIVSKKTRASFEKEETKRKSDMDETNLDSLKELENMGDVRILDENEKIDPSSLNIMKEGGAKYLEADTVDETSYQDKNMLRTELKLEQCLSDNLVDNALVSKQVETRDNATSGVKIGLISAGVAAATAGIATTFLADLKESNKISSHTSVGKLSDNVYADLKVNDNNINKTVLNDNGNDINESGTRNITDVKTEYGSNIDDGEQLSTNNKLDVDKYEGINPEDNKMIYNGDLSRVAQSEPGTRNITDVKTEYGSNINDREQLLTNNNLDVDKYEGISPADGKIIYNKDLSRIAQSESGTGNITNVKTEYGSNVDDGKQLSTNNNLDVDKYEGISSEDSIIIYNKDLSRVAQSESGTENVTDVKTEYGSNIDDGGQLSTNNNLDVDKYEGISPEDSKIISNKDLSKVAQSESGTGNITDGKTEYGSNVDDGKQLSTNNNLDVDKYEGISSEDSKIIYNKDLSRVAQSESGTENVTDVKTEYGSNIDDGEQLSTNNNLDVNKYESISPEVSKIISTKDGSRVSQSDVTEGIMTPNEFLIKNEKLDTYTLVSEENKIFSDNLSNTEFDLDKDFEPNTYVYKDRDYRDNEILSLDTSDKIDKQVSEGNIIKETTLPKAVVLTDPLTKDIRESDSELQPLLTSDTNIGKGDKGSQNISIRDDVTNKISKNDEDIVLNLNRQKDLQDVLEKEKELLELDETRGNDETQSGLKREDAFQYKDMDMKQSINIFDNDGQSNISNNVIKGNISSDKLGERDDLSENLLKPTQIQPESKSGNESLKEIHIEKAADGDKQKKQQQYVEQLKTKIDLGLHIYTNENNELILKSFDSRTPPSRYSRDSVIVTSCDLEVPFELKVPFGTNQHLSIQIKDNENMTEILPSTAISSKNSIIRKRQIPKLQTIDENTINSTVKNATKAVKSINKDIVKAQMKDIYGTYENELVPLQKSLTRLKQDVDVLILHQRTIRNNMICKRLKIQGSRKCGCTKKL